MKSTTIHSLITCRTLLDQAMRLTAFGDRHSCSAALILMQDALELVMLTLLIEKDIDELKSLESKSFDELIAEMKKADVKVPKSGTLKALNKERVIVKHYAQLAEPVTVQNYAAAAEAAVDSMITQVIGRGLRDIFLTDLLDDGEAKEFLTESIKSIEDREFLNSLISVRKAIFVEIEKDYSIHEWEDIDAHAPATLGLGMFMRGGQKAAFHKKNKQWIEKNIICPIQYIQIDSEQLRLDGFDWGINTAELENLRRLTPPVFRPKQGDLWFTEIDAHFLAGRVTAENANYCLDRAIAILVKKQQYFKTHKWLSRDWGAPMLNISDYLGAPIFSKATQSSTTPHVIREDYSYKISGQHSGFDNSESYFYVWGTPIQRPDSGIGILDFVTGFVLQQPAVHTSPPSLT